MRKMTIWLGVMVLLLAACGPAPTPAPTLDLPATMKSISETMVAGTLTAQPTNTLPPTDTATPTIPPPTDTPIATETAILTATPTWQTQNDCYAPTGTISLVAPFKIENFTKSTVTVFINGTTQNGGHPINCSYDVAKSGSILFTIWFGKYTYWVEVPSKKIYQGSFWVNDGDKATMQVKDNGIKIGPFP